MHKLILGITGIAAAAAVSPAQATTFYGLLGSDRIVTFNSATPGTIVGNSAIVGLGAGEVLTGIDVRPATREIYTVATSGNVYRLVPGGGAYNAVLVGNVTTTPVVGTNFGIDFNPVPDRLRFVSDGDQNLRINPNTGIAIVDGAINPMDLNLIGSAYTNSFNGGSLATSLFGIDSLTASLVRSINPNAGSYVSVGSLGLGPIGTDARIGFDIVGRRNAFLAYNDNFYSVNLDSGSATLIGAIGGPGNVRGLTANIPEPGVWAMLISGFGLIGVALRRRRGRALLPA